VYSIGGVAQAARPLFKAATVAPFGTAAKSLFDDLSQSMAGAWAFAGGEFYLKPGVYSASVLSLTEADLATVANSDGTDSQTPITISAHKERAQKINTVKATIWDVDQDYKQSTLPPLAPAALLARDGAELVQSLTLPAVGYSAQALHIAGVMLRDLRDPLSITAAFKLRAYPVELFDTVDLTIPRYGWAAKSFIVQGRNWNPDGSLVLTMKESSAAITQMDSDFSVQGFAANTNLPDPWSVVPVGPLTITSGTSELVRQADGTVVSRMRVSWLPINDPAVVQSGQIEIQFRAASSDGAWGAILAPGSETSAVTADVADNTTYIVRARARTTLMIGPWELQVAHKVLGKSEAPGTVQLLKISGQTLTWDPIADIDLAGYRIKFQYSSNTEWGTASQLHTGLITQSPYVMATIPPGSVTIMVRAVDTSGNESVDSAYVMTDLGDTPVANVLETHDYRALGWPGTIANASILGGNIEATQNDPYFGADTGNFYGFDVDYFYHSNFDAMTWTSAPWVPDAAAEGANMSASWGLAGNSHSVDYRDTGPEPFFIDGDYFYSDDAAQFYSGAGAWSTWPGSIAGRMSEYQWRVVTQSGLIGGVLSAFSVSLDVEDKTQRLGNVALLAAGSRLVDSAGHFSVIQNVQLTLQGGSSAVAIEITDKNATLGPLVIAKNSSGVGVVATVDAFLQGY
jgi:hypothetical protein